MRKNSAEISTTGVSVIICCYNSAARLPLSLGHLAAQEVPADFSWEIVLVNNASTDHTVSCAQQLWAEKKPMNADCRIVEEPRPGQMFARKKGAREARYECLVFCDDDNLLEKGYVYRAWQVMTKDRQIGAAGGQNHPVTDADGYPDWFETYKDKYALGVPAAASGDVTHRGFVLGAGMVTTRTLFLQALDDRYPSLLNGRNGEKLTTGDDFEYCKRLLLWGYRLYYDQDLRLQHFIPRERLNIAYRERLMEGIHEATRVLSEYDRALYLLNKAKKKNKWRLLALAPFRIFLSRMGWSSRNPDNERLLFFYLAPFPVRSDPVSTVIKRFINRK